MGCNGSCQQLDKLSDRVCVFDLDDWDEYNDDL